MKRTILLFLLAVSSFLFSCQRENLTDPEQLKKRFQRHIETLASDEMEGRETGQLGEAKAADYIINEFSNIGLSPLGDGGEFTQEFEFLSGKDFEGSNKLTLDGQAAETQVDYFPMNFSGNGEISGSLVDVGFGIQAPELGLDEYSDVKDLEGNIALMDVSSPDGIHPHSKYSTYHDLRNRCTKAQELGAAAVVLVNKGEMADDPRKNYTRKMARINVPVVFLSKSDDANNGVSVDLSVSMEDRFGTGKNVVGFLDNQASNTIIFGAHYDHLGYGTEGSLYRGEERQIHNGADDNASGTGLVIELARYFKNQKESKSNYLFIAFSGEEKGLLGSSHYAKNPTIDLGSAKFMVNLDMVGRMDTLNNLIVTGVGTSPVWDSLVDGKIAEGLNVQEKLDGVGPSDHTSFYLKDIPVLNLFTGAHPDYHKPSDDAELINYEGMVKIYSYMIALESSISDQEMIEFTKTKDSENENAPRFTVTLGVVPDYAYSGKGMKIDGVTEGKPANKAGLLAGDVVVKMGDIEVLDMMAYMNALSQFKKGDSTTVKIERSGEFLDFAVRF